MQYAHIHFLHHKLMPLATGHIREWRSLKNIYIIFPDFLYDKLIMQIPKK